MGIAPTMTQDHPHPSDPSPARLDLSSLNTHQRQAVEALRGPVLVLAGAGSGKTRVLTHKISHLIESGAYPSSILAVTFTNKAAREMTARVEQLLGAPQHQLGLWIGTFHSICGRLLRREIGKYQDKAGRQWASNFVIYDETSSLGVVKEAIRALNLDEKLYNPKTLRYQISNLKNDMVSAYDYASEARDFRTEQVSRIYDVYETLLCQNNALDFDDLLLKSVELLQQHPDVLDRYHRQFQHILVDEFQDTNNTQYELVRLIAENTTLANRNVAGHGQLWQHRSFTVVGDVDQSIYSWRGANFKILLNFQKDFPDTQLIKLEDNYRSTQNILQMANAIIEHNDERLPKVLRSVKGGGDPIHCYEAQDDRDEALFIINKFLDWVHADQVKPGDCCILYRTNAQSRSFEDVFMSKGLSYTMVGGTRFYERREIKDVLAYLTVVFNPADSVSIKRIINVPKRSIGKTTLDNLEAYAAAQGTTLWEALLSVHAIEAVKAKATKSIQEFVGLIEQLKAQQAHMSLDDWIVYICEKTGMLEALKAADPMDMEGRVQNVEEFVSVAKQYLFDVPDGDLASFLTQMSLLSDTDTAASAEDRFTLMTMHAAKGLEFPVVAIAGLEEGLFPHSRSQTDNSQMEEERRLMYVGITRAEDRLLLTYARRRLVFGELRYAVPSRFLKEVPQDLLTGLYSLDQDSRSEGGGDRFYAGGRSSEGARYGSGYGGGGSYSDRSLDYEGRQPQLRKNSAARVGGSSRASSSRASSTTASSGARLLPVGTRVGHAKFGQGTIEQVLGEGAKAIYSVQFDGIQGKKLLDPQVARLERL
ncbi:MAG: UvrD-helicase domain-containing protein [Cyanobacteria bacterium HKST-UBA06]|nr:UvrD-helicase domain-containing protein [Cyanobacteria bacterium HKST-UBA06]